jgi:hypothetical protein
VREEIEEILNFNFLILNEEEDEEVAFCCDLRSLPLWLFRTWSRMLQGRTGTRCPSYDEEIEEAASSSSDF